MENKLVNAYKKGYNKDYLSFDALSSNEEKLNFIRGLIESIGLYSDEQLTLSGNFTGTLVNYLIDLTFKPMPVKPIDGCSYLQLKGDRAKDFLGIIYNNFKEDHTLATEMEIIYNSLKENYTLAKETKEYIKRNVFNNKPSLQFYLEDKDAVIPSKAYLSDTGYDLTIIKKVKDIGDKTTLYDTGIVVVPPDGYYTRVVGRSSISKTGYTLANCEGIIDNAYRGTIKIALHKYDMTKPEIELPCKIAQLIIEKRYDLPIEIIKEKPQSVRGDGGFGSTNEK